jgi:hypothetical protein
MRDTGTKKHAALAEEFIQDKEKADWHDGPNGNSFARRHPL